MSNLWNEITYSVDTNQVIISAPGPQGIPGSSGSSAYSSSAGISASTSQTNFSSLSISGSPVATQAYVLSQVGGTAASVAYATNSGSSTYSNNSASLGGVAAGSYATQAFVTGQGYQTTSGSVAYSASSGNSTTTSQTNFSSLSISGSNVATQNYVNASIQAHNLTTTNVHGLTDTSIPNRLAWNSTDQTLTFQTGTSGSITAGISQDQFIMATNRTLSLTMAKGQVVKLYGSQGNRAVVSLASASTEFDSSTTLGFVAESIGYNANGLIQTSGYIENINTAHLTEGGLVWLSTTSGSTTSTIPTAPYHRVLLGVCVVSHAVNGKIFIRTIVGYEIEELHNVLITSVANDDILKYDSSASVWKNTPISNASVAYSTLSNSTNQTTFSSLTSSGSVRITDVTESSNSTTGALVVSGGTGIAKNLYVGGDLQVSGSVYFSGSAVTISGSNLSISDPLIYMANGNPANLNDIGIVGHFNDGTYQHTGLVRDHTDSIWKIFSGVTTEPTNTVAFSEATYDALQIGSLRINSGSTTNATLSSSGNLTANSGSFSALSISGSSVATQSFVTSQGYLTSSGTIATASNSLNLGGIPAASYLTISSASSTYQPLDGDLTAIAQISSSSGILRKTAVDTWTLDTSNYATTSDVSSASTATLTTATGRAVAFALVLGG